MWAPFFTQHLPMSCVGIAILNAALNHGEEPLRMSETSRPFSAMRTDVEAEGWIMAQIKSVNPSSDPYNYGSSIRAAPLILGSAWRLIQRPPTPRRIREAIDGNRTVIMGVDINTTRKDINGDGVYDNRDRQWHAITVMRTPDGVCNDTETYRYYVVNADPTDEYGEGVYFSEEQFDAYLSEHPALYGEWVEGPGSN